MNIYLECNMGAAGDMLASALVDLFDDKEKIIEELNSLSLPDTKIKYGEKKQNSVNAVHLDIIINGETENPETQHKHHHGHRHGSRNLSDVFNIIDSLNVSNKVKNDVKNVYNIVAAAESEAHGVSVGEVHFHELGMLDAIADITLCAYMINKLNPERIISSPINVGNGSVKCAHGILPVPAPATANILTGVPFYKSDINTELCTPTGAAIIKYYTDEFSIEPVFQNTEKIGTGAGTKELERANILRAFMFSDSTVCELSCNVDDMSGEDIAFACERIMELGALDCFTSPVYMKKGRAAYLLTVICKTSESEKFAKLIFKHTSTIGIRKYCPSRYTLNRTLSENGAIHIKRSEGYGATKEKIEFEDLKKYAIQNDISISEARRILENVNKN